MEAGRGAGVARFLRIGFTAETQRTQRKTLAFEGGYEVGQGGVHTGESLT